ncbi:MAG: hypothetical protein D6721_08065 [Gammaproteobacteria bacterium]|nr:MAG: hypothetical protein D6721_08065 [Gammaproteobacteria bacterium]
MSAPDPAEGRFRRRLNRRMGMHRLGILFSMLFALAGFSYNVWRMEATEQNERVRTASFEILTRLAALEQVLFAAHYDQDPEEGNPRRGWVLVGLIEDLSMLASPEVEARAHRLRATWAADWEAMPEDPAAVQRLEAAIEAVRDETRRLVRSLH